MSDGRVVVGLGELLWDLFPQGRKMGGAPANFAFHAAALGDRGVVASRVGDDDGGRDILARLEGLGLDTRHVQVDPAHPTGTVQVDLDAQGQPHYTITEGVAWDFIAWTDSLRELAARTDAVCFGSLAQRHSDSKETILAFLKHVRPEAVRVFDVNLRQAFFTRQVLADSLRAATIVKLNDDELPRVLATLGQESVEDIAANARRLLNAYGLELVCVTRGEHGSVLVTRDDVAEHAGYRVQLADAVGAGDAFTAALVHHYLRGAALERMNDAANRLGSWVASQDGATPTPDPSLVAEVASGN